MEKIVIALNLIIDYIESENFIDQDGLADFLYNTGFEDHEIRQAISFLDIDGFSGDPKIRTFTRSELVKLNQQTVQFIQKLYLYGIFEVDLIEEIIEKAIESKVSKVTADYFKQIIIFTLLEKKKLYLVDTDIIEELS